MCVCLMVLSGVVNTRTELCLIFRLELSLPTAVRN